MSPCVRSAKKHLRPKCWVRLVQAPADTEPKVALGLVARSNPLGGLVGLACLRGPEVSDLTPDWQFRTWLVELDGVRDPRRSVLIHSVRYDIELSTTVL